ACHEPGEVGFDTVVDLASQRLGRWASPWPCRWGCRRGQVRRRGRDRGAGAGGPLHPWRRRIGGREPPALRGAGGLFPYRVGWRAPGAMQFIPGGGRSSLATPPLTPEVPLCPQGPVASSRFGGTAGRLTSNPFSPPSVLRGTGTPSG